MADTPLFVLDAKGRWRLAYDDLQWVLQKATGNPDRKTTPVPFKGISFVATHKRILLEVIHEKGVSLTPEAVAKLETLPDTFKEFRSALAAVPELIGGPTEARKPVLGTRTPARPIDTPTRTPNRHDVAIHIAH